jgi:hypothetical protein
MRKTGISEVKIIITNSKLLYNEKADETTLLLGFRFVYVFLLSRKQNSDAFRKFRNTCKPLAKRNIKQYSLDRSGCVAG